MASPNRCWLLLSLVWLAGCGVDPCREVSGPCLAVHLEGEGGPLDAAVLTLRGSATLRQRWSSPEAGSALPIDVALSLSAAIAGSISVDAEGLAGGRTAALGRGAGTVAPGAPGRVVVRLGAVSGATCADTFHDGSEIDVDCGGGCAPCGDGLACEKGDGCQSLVCQAGRCAAPSCADRVRNGGEADVDCGGPGACARCEAGRTCAGAADCAAGRCEDGTCRSCSDGLRSGAEADVDCGGPCGKCGPGRACSRPDDCASGLCQNGECTTLFRQISRDMDAPAFGCSAPLKACHGTDMPSGLLRIRPNALTDPGALLANHQDVVLRVNRAAPTQSIFLTKVLATSPVVHLGGKTYFRDESDPIYQRWLAWIQAGAPF